MNDNHRRHLFHTVQHMDELLSEAEQIMATAGSDSPFQKYSQDTTPVQRRVAHDYISRVRQVFHRILEDLKIPPAQPMCGTLWAARCQVDFAVIDVAEMDAKHMLGYGGLSDEDTRTLERIGAELNGELNRISSFLAAGPAADLQARLGRLETTQEEIKLLHELNRIITTYGLVELRSSMEILVARAEVSSFEIGVFGRVSSGKSSLLNYLLEQEVLPVGVTPVTAIPTRIVFGPEAKATIQFAEGLPKSIPLQQLSEFSTEQENPANAKHVSGIRIEVAARRLREGVMFVDTPGLGSLATSGAEETMAYLPKCDLGIVLLDAGGALGQEDLAVVQALLRTGAAAMVLISKADLLGQLDRRKMREYVCQHLLSEAGFELPVHLVSVVGIDARTADQWFDNVLSPLFDSHRERSAATSRRKVGLLKENVMDNLNARLNLMKGEMGYHRMDGWTRVAEALRGAHAILERVEKEGRTLANTFRDLASSTVRSASLEIAAAWDNKTNDDRTVLLSFLHRFSIQESGRFLQSLMSTRSELTLILKEVESALAVRHQVSEELPSPGELPIMDCSAIVEKVQLRRPPFVRFIGRNLRSRFAQARLSTQIGDLLADFFNISARRLDQWFIHALGELRNAFNARAGLYRSKIENAESGVLADQNRPALETDIALLKNWPG